jgi:SMI1-KNR4 cell-wall
MGLIFPKEYRDHLLTHNGGRCTLKYFHFKGQLKDSFSSIDWFLAICDGKHDNLLRYFYIFKIQRKRLPFRLIPIAHDPGGNLICISCDGVDNGFIYFWDHENEVDYQVADDSDFSNLYLIAKSFNEFLDGLTKDFIIPQPAS